MSFFEHVRMLSLSPSCVMLLCTWGTLVSCHRPLLNKASCDSDFATSGAALSIPDPTISWSFKHYADCTSRALWMSFKNPSAGFRFYVGVGVPTQERFADLRADALIVGPGLPALTAEELSYLPDDIREDPILKNSGAVLHRSPEDQSNCNHLGATMQRSSTIRNGRCDFYEPYGRTNSWRVLDADNNVMPTAGAVYHVAVFLQKHTSGKFGVAVGTWQENFWKPFALETPGCVRSMSDFSEQLSKVNPMCFPVVACPATPPISKTTCEDRGGLISSPLAPTSCPMGKVTDRQSNSLGMDMDMDKDMNKDINKAGMKMQTSCGGERCPKALEAWSDANRKMHEGMAIRSPLCMYADLSN